MAKNWTEEEEEHIRQNFLKQTYGELGEHFGVSTKAMESKIRRLGLKKQELLAEAEDPFEPEPEPEPEMPVEPPSPPEDLNPTPIESIHNLQRRIEVFEETKEERAERLQATRDAAETEKARRAELREDPPVAKAVKTFEAGVKKLMDGKRAQAAKDFQSIIDDPPPDLGLVMRARQYLAAAEATEDAKPTPKSAEDMYSHGVVLLNAGDFGAAIEILEQAAQKAPKDDRIPYAKAAAQACAGDTEGAIEALAAAIAANRVNRIYARNDPDFAALRGTADFKKLLTVPDADDE
jgi:tetratricopeptide (TPR) repeat protein